MSGIPKRFPPPQRKHYFSAIVTTQEYEDERFFPDGILKYHQPSTADDPQYTEEITQWYIDGARATLRRQIISQALKQHYAPPHLQPANRDEITKAVANGNAHSIKMAYPAEIVAATASDGGTDHDGDYDCYGEDKAKLKRKFEKFSKEKYPTIPFVLLMRCGIYCDGYDSVLYNAPLVANATNNPKTLHMMMHALILSGFLTFTILPFETGGSDVCFFPLGMLVWHYLANRAGLIPDFDFNGVQAIMNDSKLVESLKYYYIGVPMVDISNGEGLKGNDCVDFDGLDRLPMARTLYNAFITRRQQQQFKKKVKKSKSIFTNTNIQTEKYKKRERMTPTV